MNREPYAVVEEQMAVSRESQADGNGMRKTEVLFGVIMAVAAFSAIWGAVSLLISWFLAS